MSNTMLNRDIEKLEKKIKNKPNDISSMVELANLLMSTNQVYPAISLYEKILSIKPSSQIANDLGVGYVVTSRLRLAEQALARAISLDPNNGDAHFNLAGVYKVNAQYEQAIEHFKICYSVDPKAKPRCIAAIAMIKEAKGMVGEAFEDVKGLIDEGHLNDEHVLRSFASIILQHTDFCGYINVAVSAIQSLLDKNRVSAHEVKSFHFILGNLFYKKNELKHAFDSFGKAHSLTNHLYSARDDELLVDKIFNRWESALVDEIDVLSPSKQTMIFIVGLPRSGSTLLEQILSCNPLLTDLGECDYYNSSIKSTIPDCNDLANKGGRPLSSLEAQQVRRTYRQTALKAGKLSRFVSDKTLPNYYYIGQILQVFPNAKIVWSLRDPRDCCLSIYTHDFAGGHEYRHDLSHLARHANLQHKLMSFWKDKYPEKIHVAQYENLVVNPEEHIKQLVDFCGFEWDMKYLTPHDNTKLAATYSYNQIKKPIYSTSVGRWISVKKFLEPLLNELKIPEVYNS